MDDVLYHLIHDAQLEDSPASDESWTEIARYIEAAREIRAEENRRWAKRVVADYYARRERARQCWIVASWIMTAAAAIILLLWLLR